MSMHKILRYHY